LPAVGEFCSEKPRVTCESCAAPVGKFPGNCKILVVDDSRAMRRIVVRTLREAGFAEAKVIEAGNGAEAVEIARRERPDAVVADWNMPVMDGLSLVKALKAEKLCGICGLVTSDVAGVRGEALAAGAQFVLPKPVTADGLRTALAELNDNSRPNIPTAQATSQMLSTLLGVKVAVEPGHKAVFAGTGLVLVGLFEQKQGAPGALVACDLELAASLAAAMSGAPAGSVAETVRSNSLGQEQLDSLREMLNVASGLFGPAGASPVKLSSVHTQLRSLPTSAVVLAVRPRAQGIFSVTVPGFGSGGMCVCIG
jgi:two-component system chemotaxis response regulator CheY